MTLRLVIRSLLTAAAGLLVGFAGALIVISIVSELDPGDASLRVAAGYLSWLLLALLTIEVVRRFMPGWRARPQPMTPERGSVLRFSRVRHEPSPDQPETRPITRGQPRG